MMIGNVWLTKPMIPDLCKELGVHRTTVARWLEQRKLPRCIESLLDLTHNGNLERIHAKWDGWWLNPRSGELEAAGGSYGRLVTFTVGDIMSIQIRMQQVAALQRDKDDLKAQAEGQKKKISALENQLADQQELSERLEHRLVELTSNNVIPMKRSRTHAASMDCLVTPRKLNG